MTGYVAGAVVGSAAVLWWASRRTRRRLEDRGLLLVAFVEGSGSGLQATMTGRGDAVQAALRLQAEALAEGIARDEAEQTLARYGLSADRIERLQRLT